MTNDENQPVQNQEEQTQPRQQSISVDDANAGLIYANFCRVTSTPEEVILDLGLNPQPLQPADAVVKISERVIMNHYTAKRLLNVLGAAIQRHEKTFGPLQVNVQNRIQNPAKS